MGELPAREGVRREARVDQDERALHPLVAQVGVAAARAAAPSASPCRRSSCAEKLGITRSGPAADLGDCGGSRRACARTRRGRRRGRPRRRRGAGGRAAPTSRAVSPIVLELHRHVAPADRPAGPRPRPRRRGSARARRGAPRRRAAGSRRDAVGARPAGAPRRSTARKNSSGSWRSMPAPSPVSGSAPAAPRCSRFSSAVSARSSVSCDGDPVQPARRRRRRTSRARTRGRRARPARSVVGAVFWDVGTEWRCASLGGLSEWKGPRRFLCPSRRGGRDRRLAGSLRARLSLTTRMRDPVVRPSRSSHRRARGHYFTQDRNSAAYPQVESARDRHNHRLMEAEQVPVETPERDARRRRLPLLQAREARRVAARRPPVVGQAADPRAARLAAAPGAPPRRLALGDHPAAPGRRARGRDGGTALRARPPPRREALLHDDGAGRGAPHRGVAASSSSSPAGQGERDPYLDKMAKLVIGADTLEEKVFLMQVFFERLIIPKFRMIAKSSPGTVLENLCNRLAIDDGIHHGAGVAYERVLLRTASKKTKAKLVKAANVLLPVFVEHELWRPRERAWIGERDALGRHRPAAQRGRPRRPPRPLARRRRRRRRSCRSEPARLLRLRHRRGEPLRELDVLGRDERACRRRAGSGPRS